MKKLPLTENFKIPPSSSFSAVPMSEKCLIKTFYIYLAFNMNFKAEQTCKVKLNYLIIFIILDYTIIFVV